jgi:hypothetical protein
MIYFDIQDLSITNSKFQYNGLSGDTASKGMLVISLVDSYAITLTNNTFDTIYTNTYSAIYFHQSSSTTSDLSYSISIDSCSLSNIVVTENGPSSIAISSLSTTLTGAYNG